MRKLDKLFTGILILSFCGLCFAACAGSPAPATSGGNRSPEPPWIRNPGSAYPDSQYVVATGDGKTMEEAQYKARANLLGIFGMKLADESVIAEMFQQTSTGGGTNWSETVSSDRRITSSAEGILSGCEIKENFNRGNEYFALAVMEKARTITIYNDIIARLSQAITELLDIPNKNTIDGYSRYRLAAILGKDIDSCVTVIRFVGGGVPSGLGTENQYLTEANNIIKTIPVGVVVTGDRNNRIRDAFAKALAAQGFQSGGNNSRYRVNVEVNLSDAPSSGSNIFIRYEINANFIDTNGNTVLIPYNITDREGHSSRENAENRVFTVAEQKIANEYSQKLKEFLSQLLPK